MKDRLLARLKSRKGFTLIELLVVIAIIAVLVVIVVVAINPVQRLNDASDRTAESNVRSAGTLVGVCITQALSTGGNLDSCDDATKVATLGQGNVPTDVLINNDVTVTPTSNICVYQVQTASADTFAHYQSATGEVVTGFAGPGLGAAPVCPNIP